MQTNRKENEHVENSLRQLCDLVFRTAVSQRCSQHREAAVRNKFVIADSCTGAARLMWKGLKEAARHIADIFTQNHI